MWHSATAAAVTLLQEPHLLIGGVGGVIAVIVGGVVSVITLRNARRSVAQPAPNPQPAPASRRPAPPIGYGEPAPPTSPARRLYAGPIALHEPPLPQPAQDEPASAEPPEPTESAASTGSMGSTGSTSLFNPDVFSADAGASAQPGDPFAGPGFNASPALRSARSLAAEWRAQAAPLPPAHLTHAPIWNLTPFARPESALEAKDPLVLEMEAAIAPPIWRVGYLSERLADTPAEPASPPAEPLAASAPIWSSWLRPAAGPADEAPLSTTFSATDAVESEPPIWSSYLRPDEPSID